MEPVRKERNVIVNSMRTFEQFLMEEVHAKIFPQLLDNDISDHFNDWIGQKEVDEIIEWADLYGRECAIKGKEEILK